MNKRDRRFLEHLKSASSRHEFEAALDRQMMRRDVELRDYIRAVVLAHGIDPARVRCLELGDRAAAVLAAIPDTSELQRADCALVDAGGEEEAGDGPDPRAILTERIGRVVDHWAASGATPDFERDPLVSVLGWCFAQHPIEAPGAEPAEGTGSAAGDMP